MLLLEQDTTKKWRVEETQLELDAGDKKKYKVKIIWDSAVYARESKSGYLSGIYYLVLWEGYPKEENTWEPALAIQHFRKLISSFYKNHSDKSTANFPAINTAPPMARLIVRLTVKSTKPPKQKRGRPANNTNKQAKNWAVFDFYHILGKFGKLPCLTSLATFHVTAHDDTWLHITARNLQPTFIKTSTFLLSSLIAGSIFPAF